MSDRNFATVFSVDQTPSEIFRAITNVPGWWSEEIEGDAVKLGDEFTYRYQNVHTCKLKLVEVIPNRKVVWLVLDNYFNFTEDNTEWKGTKIIFEIAPVGENTEVRFVHAGLVPEDQCYSVCSNAWSTYINGSLRSLIATGTGRPNRRSAA